MATDLPKGPRLPAFAQAIAWVLSPVPFLVACRKRFGPVFTVRLAGLPPMVVLSDAGAVKEVLAGDPRIFQAGAANTALKPTMWLRAFGARSLLLLDDEPHEVERRLLMPAFHAERLESYRRSMCDCTDAAIARWPIDRPFALHPMMLELTLDIVLRTIFGLDEGPRAAALREAFADMIALGEHPGLQFFVGEGGALRGRAVLERIARWPAKKSFRPVVDRVDAELHRELARHREEATPRDDVFSMLLGAKTQDGGSLSDASIVDEMKTILLAAHETTATSLTWTVHELLQNPDVATKLRHELAHGDEYLDAVIREALRLHPVVPILARRLRVAARVGGREYPAATVLAPSIQLLHHDDSTWSEPSRFVPARFLGSKFGAADFLAFGIGSRRCLGMAFALLTMRTVLRRIVTHAGLRLAPRHRPRLIRYGIGFAVADGLLVVRAQASGTPSA